MPSSTSEPSSLGLATTLVALLIAGGGALVFWLAGESQPRTAPPAEAKPTPAAQPALPHVGPATGQTPPHPAVPAAAPGDVPRAKNGKPLGTTTFPDGSCQIALNDVTEDLSIVWDDRTPYSPITHTEWNNGYWWWRHGDGTYSTVLNLEINGVMQAAWMTDKMSTDNVKPMFDDAERARIEAGGTPKGQGSSGR